MISIVIVTWNNEDIITNCINSIVKHEKKVEVILVDNNSSDNTVSKVLDLKLNQVKVKKLDENVGFSKANNIGAKMASGEDILFLNPDTIIIERGLNTIFAELNDSIGIVSCKFLNVDKSLQASCYNFDTPINIFLEQFLLGRFLPKSLREKYTPYLGEHLENKVVDWTVGAFIAMKKSDFFYIGGFSEDYFLYSEDMDICYKLKQKLNKQTLFYANYKIIHLGGQSEKKDMNTTKHKKLLESKMIFSKKFGLNKNRTMLLSCYKLKYSIIQFISILHFNKSYEEKKIKYRDSIDFLINHN